jgi:hypothetical protein
MRCNAPCRDQNVDREEPVVVPMTAEAEGDEELIAAGPRLPRWLVLVAIAVVAAGALTALAMKSARHQEAAPAPSPTPTPSVISPAPQGLAGLSVQDFAIDPSGELYVLTSPPEQVVAVNRNESIRDRTPAPFGAQMVVANSTSGLVWVIVPGHQRSDVFVYAGSTMTAVGQLHVPATVVAADALENQLFMATDRGIYRGWPGLVATRLPGYTGPVQTIAADPSRFRLLAVSKSYDLIKVEEHTARDVRRPTSLRAKSIAVTDDDIWLVGFGQPSGSRVGRVDPQTLGVTLVNSGDPQADRGAIAWTGGSVFWVRYADSGALVCLDGRTGQASDVYLETDSPVVSVPGVVYAVRGTGVVRLPSPTACPG